MMQYYFVKTDLFGLRAGRVERFASQRAGAFLLETDPPIEPFDPENKKHAAAMRAQEKEDSELKAGEDARLRMEREAPATYQSQEKVRRAEFVKRQIEDRKAADRSRRLEEKERSEVAKGLRAQEREQERELETPKVVR